MIAEEGTIFRVKTPYGKLFSASYEQKTPEGSPIKKALDHALEKNADIAVIFDKHNLYHKEEIYKGISDFEKYNNGHKFKNILVIERNGKIHTHKQKQKK